MGTSSISLLPYLVACFLEGPSDLFLWGNKLRLRVQGKHIYGEGGKEKYTCLKYFQESSLSRILALRARMQNGTVLFHMETGHINISSLPPGTPLK